MIFGELYDVLQGRIHSHDSRERPDGAPGRSKNGTEMAVNEMAVNADRLVIITSVEPHYFAGYTGGRKSFLPGVASYKTIEQNHRLAMRSDAQAIALAGNPVHEDMMDALQVVKGKRIFSIQAVLDRHQHVYRVAAGDLQGSFEQAVHWANDVFSRRYRKESGRRGHRRPVPDGRRPLPIPESAGQRQMGAQGRAGRSYCVSKCRTGVGDEVFCEQLSLSNDPFQVLKNLANGVQAGLSQGGQGGGDHDLGQDIRRHRPGPGADRQDQHDRPSRTSSQPSTGRSRNIQTPRSWSSWTAACWSRGWWRMSEYIEAENLKEVEEDDDDLHLLRVLQIGMPGV